MGATTGLAPGHPSNTKRRTVSDLRRVSQGAVEVGGVAADQICTNQPRQVISMIPWMMKKFMTPWMMMTGNHKMHLVHREGGRGGLNPGPPRGPVPSQQPQHRPKVQLNRNRVNTMKTANKKSMGPVDMSVLNVPQGGVSKTVRESMAVTTDRPVPGGGRPRPKPRERTVVSLPRVKALYDYEAQDLDEISMTEGEVLELVKEGKVK